MNCGAHNNVFFFCLAVIFLVFDVVAVLAVDVAVFLVAEDCCRGYQMGRL